MTIFYKVIFWLNITWYQRLYWSFIDPTLWNTIQPELVEYFQHSLTFTTIKIFSFLYYLKYIQLVFFPCTAFQKRRESVGGSRSNRLKRYRCVAMSLQFYTFSLHTGTIKIKVKGEEKCLKFKLNEENRRLIETLRSLASLHIYWKALLSTCLIFQVLFFTIANIFFSHLFLSQFFLVFFKSYKT